MFSFLHAADIHLDSPLLGLQRYQTAPVHEIRQATRRAFENLIELALAKEVDFVLVAGDLYDGSWPDHNTGLFFIQQLNRLHQAGISLFMIQGNHDAEGKMTKTLRLPENPDGAPVLFSARRAETRLLEELGVAIHGRGFARPICDENIAIEYPPAVTGCFNIGLLHTSLEADSDGSHSRYAPCRLADLLQKDYDYWALGHIHQRQVCNERPWIVYSGNLQGRHVRETGPKGCQLVHVDKNHDVECEFCELDVVRWEHVRVDLTDVESSEAVLQAFVDELNQAVASADGRLLGRPHHLRRKDQVGRLAQFG